ncbi:uncharacterized protein LAESUDRAFT_705793 [Laetiporus sulphureus 93-53]|uniref:Uncharacterized protein n=1 Tax=Laetiporus sulphureus 93-53 TaxID=1314785 RepID=A0A165CFT0_9APHY|nr:uncharacterized protein LAESUDRAFT_705793 [Laetiporus sulphureus 93-53]KZT02732.1 hypothetical protein LAESUDRAFT_705793 [Laetiporus sulphureus 93-53]
MGSLCSKPSTLSGGDTVLRPINKGKEGHTLSSQANGGQPQTGARTAAAEAAEKRRQAEQKRGTQAANPNRGKLAAQLEASKKAPRAPEPKQEERLVWD